MNPPDIDVSPWAVTVALAAWAIGPEFAQALGAYGLILLGWFAGLLYGLFKRRADAAMPVWAYSLFTLIVCLGVSVPASHWLAAYVDLTYQALLFPVALAIPAMPDKWGAIGSWLLARWEAARGVRQ